MWMRMVAAAPLLLLAVPALAQNAGTPANNTPKTPSVPAQIGNRANGLSYQPTRNEVLPRERKAGVALSGQQEHATDQELWKLDRQSLQREGQSAKSVP
jgi:hypothetical protein